MPGSEQQVGRYAPDDGGRRAHDSSPVGLLAEHGLPRRDVVVLFDHRRVVLVELGERLVAREDERVRAGVGIDLRRASSFTPLTGGDVARPDARSGLRSSGRRRSSCRSTPSERCLPCGMNMLSVQMIPPFSGTAHFSFGFSSDELGHVARPGDAGREVAARQRLRVVVAREPRICPESTADWMLFDGAVECLVADLRRIVAVVEHARARPCRPSR